MKLVVIPRLVSWPEAKQIAYHEGGRLLLPKEALTWSNKEELNVDFWLNDQNAVDDTTAQYFSGQKQALLFKDKQTKMLLVYIADNTKAKAKK